MIVYKKLLENNPEITRALTDYKSILLLNIKHGMTSRNSRKVFQNDEVKLFSKRNKIVLFVFLDNNIKRYDMWNTRKAERKLGFVLFSLNSFML